MGRHQKLRDFAVDFLQGYQHLTQKGISKDSGSNDHKRRANAFGDNQPIVKEPKTIFELIMENFEDEMLRVLCGAALVSLVLGIAT